MESRSSLYEHYTSEIVQAGLNADSPEFKLNNKAIKIYSGAIHYFRVHPDYWRDRLLKLKNCGLNCVETYVPWNLHEPQKDSYDFGNDQTNDMSIFCQIEKFLKIAQEEDLFVIVRPGPYICAEWEFGGMPSYLLREDDLKIRTSDSRYIQRVEKYFKRLFSILTPLQFTKGGPIIAFQIENEYGNVSEEGKQIDKDYLFKLKEIMTENGVVELMFTSDTPSLGFEGTLPDVLATANFQSNAAEELKLLKEFQPEKPLMVMEFWTGWFDHWTEPHQTRNLDLFSEVLEEILKTGASTNFYMFHGGTNWGFFNGGNKFNGDYQADTTSYDYDCLLSEAGDCTEKYCRAKELIAKYQLVKLGVPPMKEQSETKKYEYASVPISQILKFENIVQQLPSEFESRCTIPMEYLEINNDSGQSFGYILYRKSGLNLSNNSTLEIEGHIRDQAIILLNGELKSEPLNSTEDFNRFGYWRLEKSSINLNNKHMENATLDILVSNWGRINFGKLRDFKQNKGLYNCNISLNGIILEDWKIKPLEFKKKWLKKLSSWEDLINIPGPAIYKANFVKDNSFDTFIDMTEWCQGIVIVNDFVLGRYCHLGPQQTLYLPAPLLNEGINTILVFEQFKAANSIKFSKAPKWI